MSGCEAASSRSAGVVGAGRALEEDGAAAAAAVGAAPSARAIELHLHLRSAWPRFEHMHALVQGGPAAAEAADGAADDAAAEASGPLAMALIAGPPSLPANGTFSLSDPVAFKPNNPAWLRAAAQGAATACLPQPCAVLQQFKDTGAQEALRRQVAAGGFFGRPAREQLFTLDPRTTYLNHGSYGATLKLAQEAQAWFRTRLEEQPVKFQETMNPAGVLEAVRQVAALVHAQPQDVVAVQNATTAVSAVLRGVPLAPHDVLLVFNCSYPAVRSAVARAASACPSTHLLDVSLGQAELQDPRQMVQLVRQALEAHQLLVPDGGGAAAPLEEDATAQPEQQQHSSRRRLRLAVLDHVVSFPPIVMPVLEMTQLLHQAGALVLVDGAHAVGNVRGLDVPALGADFYLSNLHKWCCTPKGSAFLWCGSPALQRSLLPLVTSHGAGLGWQGEWLWGGTADPSAWLAVPTSLAVLEALGWERVHDYTHGLVRRAAQLLVEQWPGHELMVVGGEGPGGDVASMLAVSLPPLEGFAADAQGASRLHDALRDGHGIEVPVIGVFGRLWVRLSAYVYNELGDYQRLVDVLRPMVATDAPARHPESGKDA